LPPFILTRVFFGVFRKPQPLAGKKGGIAFVQIAGDLAQGAIKPCRPLVEPGVRIAERESGLRYGAGRWGKQHTERAMDARGRHPDTTGCQSIGKRAVSRHLPMGAIDPACGHDMPTPAVLDMAKRHVIGQRPAPVSVEIGEDRHRIAQRLHSGPALEIKSAHERRPHPLEGAIFRRDLVQNLVPVR